MTHDQICLHTRCITKSMLVVDLASDHQFMVGVDTYKWFTSHCRVLKIGRLGGFCRQTKNICCQHSTIKKLQKAAAVVSMGFMEKLVACHVFPSVPRQCQWPSRCAPSPDVGSRLMCIEVFGLSLPDPTPLTVHSPDPFKLISGCHL